MRRGWTVETPVKSPSRLNSAGWLITKSTFSAPLPWEGIFSPFTRHRPTGQFYFVPARPDVAFHRRQHQSSDQRHANYDDRKTRKCIETETQSGTGMITRRGAPFFRDRFDGHPRLSCCDVSRRSFTGGHAAGSRVPSRPVVQIGAEE